MSLPTNLKKLRNKRGITQQRVSDMTGITRSTYTGYEIGVCEPSIKTLILLSKFYDTTLDGLIK